MFIRDPTSSKLYLAVLIDVKPAGTLESNSWLTLGSMEDMSIKITVTDFIPHRPTEGYTVSGSFSRETRL